MDKSIPKGIKDHLIVNLKAFNKLKDKNMLAHTDAKYSKKDKYFIGVIDKSNNKFYMYASGTSVKMLKKYEKEYIGD